MAALDLSHLTPPDAVAALRSYPRRFRSLIRPLADDEDIDEIAHRAGRDGRSVMQVVSDLTRTFVLLEHALQQIAMDDEPLLHPAVLEPGSRHWETEPPASVDEALTLLADAADALAERTSTLPGKAWQRTAPVAGGGTVTALGVIRDAVGAGRDGLDEVERILREVRG
ncbi:hypothetical protein [Rhabdothermincola sp.]|uniref:hypothetical protein n=1 Tax=Rhabdothermincola sp. TaxID=2820405 RepID=UPI002FDF30B0